MPTGHLKAGIVVIFAVMFGVVQLICACMPQSDLANSLNAPMQMTSSAGEHAHMDHNQVVNSHGAEEASHNHNDASKHDHDNGCDDGAANCSHCAADVVLSAALDQAPPSVITTQSKAALVHTKQTPSQYYASMAPSNLAGLRWLDPPRQSPVTLKTRLLT